MTLRIQDKDKAAEKYASRSLLPRTLLGGTVAMRAARETFTPREPGEQSTSGLTGYDERYEFRLQRCSFLTNFYAKTAGFLTGQVFQQKINFSDDMPAEIDSILKDIDGKGNDANVFFSRIFYRGLAEGSCGARIDSNVPAGEEVMSVEEEKARGYRPVLRGIQGVDVLGVNGSGEPDQIRISGSESVPDGDYGSESTPVVMLGNRETWQLYTKDSQGGEYIAGEHRVHGASRIPVAFFTPGEEISWALSKTPLDDLAYLQHQHWLDSGDLKKIIHTAQRPMLHLHNIDSDVITAGSDFAYTSSDYNADGRELKLAPFIKYTSVTGEGIEHGRKSIEDLEQKIGLWGLMQLIPQTVSATATEKNFTAEINVSSLAMWAIEFESFMQRIFELLGEVLGVEVPDNCCELNKEFMNLSSMPMTEVLDAVEAAVIPKELAYAEFKRRRGIGASESWEDARAMIENEGRVGGGDIGLEKATIAEED